MFAHQIIEDLNNISKLYNISERYAQTAIACLDFINKSIHFTIEDLLGSLELAFDNRPVYENFLNLPYKKIWIDFIIKLQNGKISKNGVLVTESESEKEGDKKCIRIYIYSQVFTKKWIMHPNYYTIREDLPGVVGKVETVKSDEKGIMKSIEKIDVQVIKIIDVFLKILNCKNIVVEKIHAHKKLNKKRRLAGKQEIFDYHVLNVVTPSAKREYQEKHKPLSHNRVHLCRGHFKEYTKEHPLFGKLTGIYWWQPHARGQNKNGIVIKDYNIKNAA